MLIKLILLKLNIFTLNKMTKIIAIANQKGGVGKTTSTVNLAYALSNEGRRVLVVDVDPQGNLTQYLNNDPR